MSVPPIGPQISGAIGGCDFHSTLLSLRKYFEGGGTYVLSEYAIEGQGFRFGEEAEGIVLHPVVYQFCANWGRTKKETAPPNFEEINKFCGMKFIFQSETREELSKLPDEHVTTYDRVLEGLLPFLNPGAAKLDPSGEAGLVAVEQRLQVRREVVDAGHRFCDGIERCHRHDIGTGHPPDGRVLAQQTVERDGVLDDARIEEHLRRQRRH